jgi:hypothetical protein
VIFFAAQKWEPLLRVLAGRGENVMSLVVRFYVKRVVKGGFLKNRFRRGVFDGTHIFGWVRLLRVGCFRRVGVGISSVEGVANRVVTVRVAEPEDARWALGVVPPHRWLCV